MGVKFSPKKSIAAFSKSFVKTVCVANGIDINTADAIASASGGLIEGFSYEKRILPPNSKLYKLVSTSVVTSLKNNKLKSSKELQEKIVVNVFSLDNLLAEAAMEKILKSAELYLTCTETKLKSVVQEILIAIEDGIRGCSHR